MSYILDALKKSEQERKLGEVPQLATVHEPAYPAPARRPWRLWAAVAGAGLAVAAVAVWFLWQRTPALPSASGTVSEPGFAARPAGEPAPRSRAPAGGGPATPHIVQPTLSPMQPVAVHASPAIRPAVPQTPPVRRPAAVASVPSGQAREAATRRAVPEPSGPRPPAPVVVPAPKPGPSPHPPAATTSGPAVAVSKPAPVVSPPPAVVPKPGPVYPASGPASAAPRVTPVTAESTAGIPSIDELPVAVRQDLPRMQINIHAYDADPAKRFVLIDMHRYQEKQGVEGGAVVDAITPDGVVLKYRGRRFLLPRQ